MLIFAVRLYGLTINPCQIAGNTVGKKTKSLNFWTKEEFDRFIATFEKGDPFYTAFLILYYTALESASWKPSPSEDIDQEAHTLTINKTYHLIGGKGIVTPPKTEKANRTITLPQFLLEAIQRHIGRLYGAEKATRLFMASHSSYARQMETHTKKAGVRRIRLHDLRHSHASLLIEMGFSALLVSETPGT